MTTTNFIETMISEDWLGEKNPDGTDVFPEIVELAGEIADLAQKYGGECELASDAKVNPPTNTLSQLAEKSRQLANRIMIDIALQTRIYEGDIRNNYEAVEAEKDLESYKERVDEAGETILERLETKTRQNGAPKNGSVIVEQIWEDVKAVDDIGGEGGIVRCFHGWGKGRSGSQAYSGEK